MCINPITIKNNRYDYHPLWHRAFLQVPCNKCEECRNTARNQLATRLSVMAWQTLQALGSVLFLTFTYNDAHLPHIIYNGQTCPAFSRKDVKQLLRALHRFYDKRGMKFYHFLVCEYGKNTKRPHYHCMFFLPLGIDHRQFAEKAREYWTHMHVKDKDIYVNNGYMFPSKTDVKLGKHLCKSVKSACIYTAKYTCKDLEFYRIPLVKEISDNKGLAKTYANYLPRTFQSCNLGYSWFADYFKENPAAVKCTNPATLQSVVIPTYAINKYCYDCYKGDELNANGERKVIRELNEHGRERRMALLDELIEARANKYSTIYGYPVEMAQKMAIYHYVYRGFSATQLDNIIGAVRGIDEFTDIPIVGRGDLFGYDTYHIAFLFSLTRFSFIGVEPYLKEFSEVVQIGYNKREFKPIYDTHYYTVPVPNEDIRVVSSRCPRQLIGVASASERCELDMLCRHIADVKEGERQREIADEIRAIVYPNADEQIGTADNCF